MSAPRPMTRAEAERSLRGLWPADAPVEVHTHQYAARRGCRRRKTIWAGEILTDGPIPAPGRTLADGWGYSWDEALLNARADAAGRNTFPLSAAPAEGGK